MHGTIKSDRPADKPSKPDVVVIGGGPAGLTAAYELNRYGIKPIVLEKDRIVGGIARTESYKGFKFDMGGHRFFTKSEIVQKFWEEILADEFITRPRLSRIFYKGKFFAYPPQMWDALTGLGFRESLSVIFSYLKWQILPYRNVESFEQWVTNNFGKRLFEIFFKTYTEKVWGIPCTELRAEWAAQRIKGLSLKTVARNMLLKTGRKVTTLIEEFEYPRQGPGMMWQAVADKVNAAGGQVKMNSDVIAIRRTGMRVDSVVVNENGKEVELPADAFISSMPITELVKKLEPAAPQDILDAVRDLKYRDFLTVCLIVDQEETFPDNWIYIHEPDVKVGRIQNFKNWSADMVPDQSKTSLGLEYFCNEGDELWTMSDEELVEFGKREIDKIGLVSADAVIDGCVYRVPKTYPVYDTSYAAALAKIRSYLDQFENLSTVGRNGMHRYNNQDHSMLTAIYAVRNLVLGESHDLWSVNADQEYHEERLAPQPIDRRNKARDDNQTAEISAKAATVVTAK